MKKLDIENVIPFVCIVAVCILGFNQCTSSQDCKAMMRVHGATQYKHLWDDRCYIKTEKGWELK